MGITKKFVIVLTNTGSVFYPGQCIEGQLLVDLAENMNMKGLFILCKSKAEVRWKAGKQTQGGNEDYLNLKLTLYGNASRDGDDVVLSAGSHVFPFKFVLPINLPGSFEGEPGCYVRHWLKAVMDRPWKFNKEYKMVFTVASVLDLNSIHNADAPIQGCASETSCSFGCCNAGTVTATFRIDKRGYVPGESFSIHGEVRDGANIGIDSTCVNFVRRTIYTAASSAQKENKIRIGNLRHGQVEPGGTDVWNGEKLRIPPIPPSFLAGCNIIDIQYHLKVTVFLSHSLVKIKLALPVIIGTVPLHSTVQQNLTRRHRHHQNTANEPQRSQAITYQPQRDITPSAPAIGASAACTPVDLLPPSYQECVFGKVDTKDQGENYTAGNVNFAPAYTYYEGMI